MRGTTTSTSRRLDTHDLVLAVGAIALGVSSAVAGRPLAGRVDWNRPWSLAWQGHFEGLLLVIRWSLPAAIAVLAPLTFAVLLMRCRRPRPAFSRCQRQPGTAACSVAAIAIVLDVASAFLKPVVRESLTPRFAIRYASGSEDPLLALPGHPWGALGFAIGEMPGLMVAGAFLSLWAGGFWRAEPSGIDRMGRVIGWLWIAVALGSIALPVRV